MENKSTFCCDVCKKVFRNNKNLNRHKRDICYRILNSRFKCEQCDKIFHYKSLMLMHMKKVHKIVKPINRVTYLLCSEHPCLDICFPSMKDLRNHRKELHGKDINKTTYTFLSLDEFNNWKESIEVKNGIQYHIKNPNQYGTGRTVYHCRRSGIYKARGAGKHKLKKQGSVKIGRYCTSTIDVLKKENGIHIVDYYPDHCGHEIGGLEAIVHTVLSQSEKQAIVKKLLQNIPVYKIIEDLKEENISHKSSFINVQDIRNIAKEFGLKMNRKKKSSKKEKDKNVQQEACDKPETRTVIDNYTITDFCLLESEMIEGEERSISLSNPTVHRNKSSVVCVDPFNKKLQNLLQPKFPQTEVKSNSTRHTTSHCEMANLKYLDQVSAIVLHAELFNEYKFSIEQVTELAGQGCARAIANIYPIQGSKQVLIVCGPGNNGADGLVCARHLKLLGYTPCAVYPKNTQNIFYMNLITQCVKYDIPVLQEMPNLETIDNNCQVIVDAVFGYSFKPPVRQEFLSIIDTMQQSKIPIVSVDIPSGWDVNNGPNINSTKTPPLEPDMLISLTFPKVAAKFFKGRHNILGGLIVPPALASKYQIEIPRKTELSQIILRK